MKPKHLMYRAGQSKWKRCESSGITYCAGNLQCEHSGSMLRCQRCKSSKASVLRHEFSSALHGMFGHLYHVLPLPESKGDFRAHSWPLAAPGSSGWLSHGAVLVLVHLLFEQFFPSSDKLPISLFFHNFSKPFIINITKTLIFWHKQYTRLSSNKFCQSSSPLFVHRYLQRCIYSYL